MIRFRLTLGRVFCALLLATLLGCGGVPGSANSSVSTTEKDVTELEFCCPEEVLIPLNPDLTHPDWLCRVSSVQIPGVVTADNSTILDFAVVDHNGQELPAGPIPGSWDHWTLDTTYMRVSFLDCAPFLPDDLTDEISFEIRFEYNNVYTADVDVIEPYVLRSACLPGAAISWDPLIPTSNEVITVTTRFNALCGQESRIILNYYGAPSKTSGEIVIPAQSASGTDTFSNGLVGITTFYASGSPSPCHYLSGFREYLVHPAGANAFVEHSGSVSSTAGAAGTMSLRVHYTIQDDPGALENKVTWKLRYQQVLPIALDMVLDIQTGPMGLQGTWDGPDGEYSYALAPADSYAGALAGAFIVDRPDGTTDLLPYSLSPQ